MNSCLYPSDVTLIGRLSTRNETLVLDAFCLLVGATGIANTLANS